MRKILFLFACFLLASLGLVNAQSRSISGTVLSDEDGQPVIGATVMIKGSAKGTITAVDGTFKISMPESSKSLVITYIGFEPVDVEAQNNMVIRLKSNLREIDEVVVTGMGIKRSSKALGYSATSVSSSDVTTTGNRSALNALQGKVAGVEITSASGAPGSSTRVIMRGFSSLGSGNQPLYVIDGVPVNNSQIGETDLNGGYDFGNRANDINPDDIESMTILQGGSGTALYGSRASAGVILITTKNGSKSGNKAKVDISSTTTFDSPLRLPVMQNEFGQGWYDRGSADLRENGSWGPRFDGKDRIWGFVVDNQQKVKPYAALENNIKDFFDTGISTNNTVAISNGDENKSFYLSYGNITSDGIMPTDADSYKRNNISLRGSSKFLDIFTGSASLNYVRKDTKAVETGQEQTALDGIWQTPRDMSVIGQKDYKNKFNNIDNYYSAFSQNPYYILNEHGNKFEDNRIFGNIGLDAKIFSWLSANFKIGSDVSNSKLKVWRAITDRSNFKYNQEVGRVQEFSYYNSELNTDFMLNIKKDFNKDLSFSAVLGHNFNQRSKRDLSAKVEGLDIPFFYNLSNSSTTPSVSEEISQRRLVGVYGSFDLGYKDFLYLNVSARNDWSSTLPATNRSYFYPGTSLSFVFSEFMKNQDILSYGKIRAGIAQTGKDADPYQIYATLVQTELTDGYSEHNFPLAGSVNGFSVDNLIGNDKLQPEISMDKELGLNLKFLQDRIGLDVTYYNKTITNLIWTSSIPYTSGFTAQTQNLGKITNNGIEISMTLVPVRTKDFEWQVFANFSQNKNMLVELTEGLDQIDLGGSTTLSYVGRPGYELGLFEGIVPATDPQGHVIVDNQGLTVFKDEKEILGNSQNKYRIGGGTSITYKNLTFHATVDYRYGGKMYSRTAEMLYFTGNAPQTTYNDRQPFIIENSVQLIDGNYVENTTPVAGFTNNLNSLYDQSYCAGIGGAYALVDKTFFKLREVSLSYAVPQAILRNTFINKIELAFVGTNLLLWTPNSNLFTDPEQTTFGNEMEANYGDYGTTPTTRSIGFNVKLGF